MKEARTALLVIATLTLLLGAAYPLIVTGIGQLVAPNRANGSFIAVDGRIVGSELIGQKFTSARYFHGRPSASGYDPMASGGSNLGPSNPALHQSVFERIEVIRRENRLPSAQPIPADLVLASASGLDPEISLDAALLQVARVAAARGLAEHAVRAVVERKIRKPFLGAFGERRVNVLELNLALDG